jgi:hypothetical protein
MTLPSLSCRCQRLGETNQSCFLRCQHRAHARRLEFCVRAFRSRLQIALLEKQQQSHPTCTNKTKHCWHLHSLTSTSNERAPPTSAKLTKEATAVKVAKSAPASLTAPASSQRDREHSRTSDTDSIANDRQRAFYSAEFLNGLEGVTAWRRYTNTDGLRGAWDTRGGRDVLSRETEWDEIRTDGTRKVQRRSRQAAVGGGE